MKKNVFLQKSFLSPQECELCELYMDMKIANGLKQHKTAHGKFWQLQGDPLTDALGKTYENLVSQILDVEVSLTYSIMRNWVKGAFLNWHRNKWECEYTVSIQISDNSWPLGFTDQDSPKIEGVQNLEVINALQGDAVFFKACELYHGRRPLKDQFLKNISLHYVEKGSYNDNLHGRRTLGDSFQTLNKPNGGHWEINA